MRAATSLSALVFAATAFPASLAQEADPFADSNQVQPEPAKAATPEYPVTIAIEAEKRNCDAPQRVLVTLTIQDGYQLTANPSGHSELGYITTLTVKGKGKPELVKVTYPKGELVKDAVIGDYRVYKGKVSLTAILKRSNEDTEPAEIAVRVFPWNARGCQWLIKALSIEIP